MKDSSHLSRVSYYPMPDQASEESLAERLSRSDEFAPLKERENHYLSPHKCKCICNNECPFEKISSSGSAEELQDKRTWTRCSCCRKMNRVCLIVCLIVSLIGLFFSYYFVESFIENYVESKLVLREGTSRFESWRQGHPSTFYKVWIFNLTNEKAFMAGAPPRVREVGPYVYKVKELKKKISFNSAANTLTFNPYPIFEFIPHLSFGSEMDMISTLNVPLVNAGVQVEESAMLQGVLKIATRVHGFQTIQHLTVRGLLWGHRSRVLDWARSIKNVPYPHEHFGLMAGHNNTPQSPYTIDTGASDISKLLTVVSYKGRSSLGAWESPLCDSVYGSLASGFHPGIIPSEKLYVFSGQICRSLPLVFQRNVSQSGLKAFRFVPPSDTFDYRSGHTMNWCFCKKNKCPPRGVLDVRSCYWGAAVAFSFPHFYQGNPVLRHLVRGLR